MFSQSPLSPLPDHVPAHLVYDFDFIADPGFSNGFHAHIAKIAREAPEIFYTRRNGGHWVVRGHEAYAELARTIDIFSNNMAIRFGDVGETIQIPISFDPPQHTVYRQVLVQAFAPKAVAKMEEQIRALCVELIDKVVARGACDFVAEVSEPLPVLIFMKLMGLPLDRYLQFREWVVSALSDMNPVSRQKIWDQVMAMTAPLIREREIARKDDLISRILDADLGGRKPTFDEMQSYCVMLINGGLDTVVNGMAFAIHRLACDPDLQEKLRAHPEFIPDAIEEMLRRYTFTIPPRFVAKDAAFRGVDFKRGELMLTFLPAIDLDPKAYKNPEDYDLERGAAHVAFGLGPHRCVGSHLARAELRILYEEWLKRVPSFRLDPQKPWRIHGGFVLSIASMPLVWDPS